jgi:hypothetical protein
MVTHTLYRHTIKLRATQYIRKENIFPLKEEVPEITGVAKVKSPL